MPLKSIFAVPTELEQARIREQVLQHQRAAARHGLEARYALIASSLLLLALLVHLGLEPTETNRISTGFYDAGHMMYLKPSAQKKLHDDVAQFIAASLH